MKHDKIWFGIIIGFFLPIVVFALVMYIKYMKSPSLQALDLKFLLFFVPKILSVCLCANLLPFYVFLKRNRMNNVRGVLISTMALALFVFVMLFV